jgi:DHA2 family methylenomycin A resistance protein-like MFS transporter
MTTTGGQPPVAAVQARAAAAQAGITDGALPLAPGRPLLVGLSLGYFMVLLDTTIVAVALPKIGSSLRGGLTALQWVSNGYTLTFAALLLTAGVVSDRLGGRRVFLVGLGAFGVISAISAASTSMAMLISTRALLGIAGAMLLPSSLSLIANAFTDPAARARALGSWAAITGAALAAGPVVGGLLTDSVGWRSIFLVNVPVAAVSLFLTTRYAPETARNLGRGIDLPGQLTAVIALAALTFGLIESTPRGWGSIEVIGSLVLALVAGAAFLLIERREQRQGRVPMLPAGLFSSRTLQAGLFAGLLVNFGLSGALFVLSLFFQDGRGYTAATAGLAFLPLTLPTAFNPVFTGRLVGRIGPKVPSTIGFALMAVGAAIQALFTGNSGIDLAATVVGLLALGFGVSFAIPSLITAIMSSVPKELTGIGGGALNSARQTGAVLGVAVLGAVLGASRTNATGTSIALAVCAALLALGAVVVYTALPRRQA